MLLVGGQMSVAATRGRRSLLSAMPRSQLRKSNVVVKLERDMWILSS